MEVMSAAEKVWILEGPKRAAVVGVGEKLARRS